MDEFWKDIPGFEGYQISNLGRVRSCRVKGCTGVCNYNSWHFVATKWQDKDNYRYVKVRCNTIQGKRVSFYLHKLLYSTFIGLIPEGMCVDHIDGNSLNNSLQNFRLATKSQNCINSKPRRIGEYKGVYKNKNRFCASTMVNGKQAYIGSFKTKEEAVKAYNDFITKHHGEFARLNIIGEVQ